jgi:hypothetical protein
MTLTYRGTTYQTSNITITTSKSKLNATYRGQSYQLNNNSLHLTSKPVNNLIYRGVKYSNVVESNTIPMIQNLQTVINQV